MVEQGKGSIVMVGSMSASIVNVPQAQAPYNASKAAVRHLAASMAVELAQKGVRVNCLRYVEIIFPFRSSIFLCVDTDVSPLRLCSQSRICQFLSSAVRNADEFAGLISPIFSFRLLPDADLPHQSRSRGQHRASRQVRIPFLPFAFLAFLPFLPFLPSLPSSIYFPSRSAIADSLSVYPCLPFSNTDGSPLPLPAEWESLRTSRVPSSTYRPILQRSQLESISRFVFAFLSALYPLERGPC
jgi:hypothetical protein